MSKNSNNKIKWYQRTEAIFSFWFLGFFLVTFTILYIFGLIPNELKETTGTPNVLSQLEQDSLQDVSGGDVNNPAPLNVTNAESPLRIAASEISLDYQVVNPSTTNNVVLDAGLQQGPVHYPGSGAPGIGNMFIFGHSTGYKVVNNKAYQVFDNIHTLQNGDDIDIYTKTSVYHYSVTSVNLEKDSDAYVDFSVKQNMLTLSTCNSFGAKEDRYVVQANYMGSEPIQNS